MPVTPAYSILLFAAFGFVANKSASSTFVVGGFGGAGGAGSFPAAAAAAYLSL